MADRINLQITEVSEPKEVGQKGAKKLSFKAKSPDGKELPYFTFRTSLFDTIKVNATLDAEVEIKTREVEGNVYTDRQLSQIFVGGNPIGGQRDRWQPQGDSPEQRQSIEQQVAIKAVVELLTAKIIEPTNLLSKAALIWMAKRLDVDLSIESSPSPQPAKATGKPVEEGEDIRTTAKRILGQALAQKVNKQIMDNPPDKPEDETASGDFRIPRTIQELADWAISKGKTFTPSWICKTLSVKGLTEISDVLKAYNELREITGWEQ